MGIVTGENLSRKIWVNFITTSRRDRALEIMDYFGEIIPSHGRKIQVSEIF
jgi:hypothetical protein